MQLGADQHIRLEINIRDARYPVTVDPLIENEDHKLMASDAAQYDEFGTSVAVSGDTVVVGAPLNGDAGYSSGSAYVFDKGLDGTNSLGLVRKLTASDAAQGDKFGISVAVSGDTVVVGADENEDAGSQSGSAYVFDRDQGGNNNFGEVKKLTASDAAQADLFGGSVSISGDTVVVGAHGNDDAGSRSGSAYVFGRDQGGTNNFGEVKKLTTSDAAVNDDFGLSVSISGDTVVVGAHGNDDAGNLSGSAYVFDRNQGGTNNFGEVKKLTASDAAKNDLFASRSR